MSDKIKKIDIYRDKSHKDYSQKQTGVFDWKQLTNIIIKDSVLLGNDIETGYSEIGLPGNKTEFTYYLKGYVDFTWKVVMKYQQDNGILNILESFKKEMIGEIKVVIKDEIQQSETRVKSYVDEKVNYSEKNIKFYVDEKVDSLRTEFKKDINSLRTEFKNETKSLRKEFKKEIQQSEIRIKSFVKKQIDNHVQDYHK